MNCFAGKKTQWIHFNNLYNVSNSLISTVYAFGLFEREPNEYFWPFFTKEVYYIGMSGGKEEPYIVDKKRKDKEKGRLETVVHKRMKDHNSKQDGKIKNLWVKKQIETGKQLYISFILPPDNMDIKLIRNWLSLVESEQLLVYQQIYGQLPVLNLAERHDLKNINEDSFSQKELKKIKENSLYKFYND